MQMSDCYLVDSGTDAAKRQHLLRLLDGEVADADVPHQTLQHTCNISCEYSFQASSTFSFMRRGPAMLLPGTSSQEPVPLQVQSLGGLAHDMSKVQ